MHSILEALGVILLLGLLSMLLAGAYFLIKDGIIKMRKAYIYKHRFSKMPLPRLYLA